MKNAIFAAALCVAAMCPPAQAQNFEGDVAAFCRQFPALQAAMVRQFEEVVGPLPSQHDAWLVFVVEVVRAGQPFDAFCASPAARAAIVDRNAWQAALAALNRRAGELLVASVVELRARLDAEQNRRLMALLAVDGE